MLVRRVAAAMPHQRARLKVGMWVELSDYSPCPTAHPYPGPLLFSLVRVMLPIRLVVDICQRILTWLLLHATRSMTDGNVRPEQDINDKEVLFTLRARKLQRLVGRT